jgi:prolyl-tRNA synthetase
MKGIEVGHIFEFGKTYSEPLGLNVLDENGKTKPVLMGSYGIGLGRTMAAIVEQLSDDKGIIWPEIVAPFSATIIAVNTKNQDQKVASESLYKDLKTAGLDVLIDDRKASFGARMKDSELLGIPFIIIAGKKADQGIFEFVDRKTSNKSEVTKADLIKTK